jgi:hypothetical protein
MRTNKHQTLLLVKKQKGVHSRDIVRHFGYFSGTARSGFFEDGIGVGVFPERQEPLIRTAGEF